MAAGVMAAVAMAAVAMTMAPVIMQAVLISLAIVHGRPGQLFVGPPMVQEKGKQATRSVLLMVYATDWCQRYLIVGVLTIILHLHTKRMC